MHKRLMVRAALLVATLLGGVLPGPLLAAAKVAESATEKMTEKAAAKAAGTAKATKTAKASKATKATKAVKKPRKSKADRVASEDGETVAVKADAFSDIREAFRRGDGKTVLRLAPQLREHDLGAWAEYYRLRMQLADGQPAPVQEFLRAHEGELVAERLRSDWLNWLADKGHWDSFDADYPKLQQPDNDLRCHRLARRFETEAAATGGALLAEARGLLLDMGDLPAGCEDLLRDLLATGRFDADDVWQRARRLTEANRPKLVAATLAFLPKSEQPDIRLTHAALDRPQRFLVGHRAVHSARPARELVLLAVTRLARQDPTLAASELERLENQLPAPDRGFAWGQVAWQAALRHQPEALAWFRATGGVPLADEPRQWWVRAALRAHDWVTVREVIEAMPPRLAGDPAWVYWLGRARKQAGQNEAAIALFTRIADQPSFYGNLASEELNRPVRLPERARPPTADELAQVAAAPGVRRALAFLQRGWRTEGVNEWNWALRSMNDRQLLAAAELARRQGIYDRAIAAAVQTQSEHDYSLRYLAPYDEQVRPAARQQRLDDAWVYGLMRQESRFVTQARSNVGAAGLMQLMPGTARWVAKKIGLKEFRPGRVAETGINVTLGTNYMRMVMENLDNHPVLASAAYNAGPKRARNWRDPARNLEGAIYAESIPFAETRDYVKKVMSNAVYYGLLFNGRPESLKTRLGVIAPQAIGERENPPKDDDLP